MASKKPDKVVNAIAATLAAEGVAAAPLDGGPFAVPLDSAAALWLIPWMCEPELRAGVSTIDAAGTTKPLYATWGDTRDALAITRELGLALVGIPDGSNKRAKHPAPVGLEMIAAASADVNNTLAGDDDAANDETTRREPIARRRTAARFRLSGTIGGGVWTITHAWPPVTNEQLASAMQILGIVDSNSTAWARDDAEAATISASAAKSAGFIRTNPAQVNANALTVHGRTITVRDDRRPYLAMILFRHRFGGVPWDFVSYQQADEKWLADYLDGMRVMEERTKLLRQRHHAPRIQVLLETPVATYYETDFARIAFARVEEGDSSSVTPLLWKRLPDLHFQTHVSWKDSHARVDAALASLGYTALGDYQYSRTAESEAYRVYGGKDDGSFVIWGIVAGSFSMQWMFFSVIDGFWVSTATFTLPESAPRSSSVSHRGVAKVSFAEQAAAHSAHVATHASRGRVSASPRNMTEFLPMIDRFNAEFRK